MNAELKKPAVALAPGTKGAAGKPKEVLEAYTFRRQGWPRVRQAAITFGAVVLLSGALVASVHLVLARTRPDTAAAQGQQIAARERYTQAETERLEIRQFQPAFEQLRAGGFAGAEDRLAMLEAIRDIQRGRALLPISYEFAPQQTVAMDPAQLGAPLELHSTTVTLHLGLLHEMDLVNFMQDLRAKGAFAVKQCDVSVLEGIPGDARQARLAAECTLFWLTISEAAPTPAGS